MFVTHGPLEPDSPLFVGRQAELAQMDQWLQQARYVGALLGGRQTGKTSLLLKLRHHFQAKYRLVYVDLEAIHGGSETDCFEFIAEEMIDQLGDADDDAAADLPGNSRHFLRFLRRLSRQSQAIRIAVLLDEVGALPPETAVKLAHNIRSVFTSRQVRPEYRRFVFILAGSTDMLQLTSGVSSPLKNVTDSIYLADLTFTEVRELLLQGSGNDYANLTAERIYHWTQGHPYLTQLLAAALHKTGQSHSDAAVDALVEKLLQIEDRNLPHLFRHLAGQTPSPWNVIRSVMAGEVVPFSRSSDVVAELELLGLIRNENGRCRLRNPFYAAAIRRRRHDQAAIDKQKLHDVLISAFNDEELQTLCFTLGVDYDSLPAQGKAGKARELILHLEHRGVLHRLDALCRRERPSVFAPSSG